MTLLLTVFAAIAATIVWYASEKARKLKVGTLCLMYWGASLMWFVDAVAEFFELGDKYFEPAPADMLNDAFLGLSVIAFGFVIYIAILLIKDPNHVVADTLLKKK